MKCPNKAEYRFTWPGEGENLICGEHVHWLKEIASTIGVDLKLLKIPKTCIATDTCQQEIGD